MGRLEKKVVKKLEKDYEMIRNILDTSVASGEVKHYLRKVICLISRINNLHVKEKYRKRW